MLCALPPRPDRLSSAPALVLTYTRIEPGGAKPASGRGTRGYVYEGDHFWQLPSGIGLLFKERRRAPGCAAPALPEGNARESVAVVLEPSVGLPLSREDWLHMHRTQPTSPLWSQAATLLLVTESTGFVCQGEQVPFEALALQDVLMGQETLQVNCSVVDRSLQVEFAHYCAALDARGWELNGQQRQSRLESRCTLAQARLQLWLDGLAA